MIDDFTPPSGQLGVTVGQIAEMMRDSLRWDADTLHHYQVSQLSQLLRHAYSHVPFYRERLRPLFGRDGALRLDRWHDIPVLSRADLRDSPQTLMADTVPPLHGPIHTSSSSGSTGIPVTVHFPALFTYVADVAWHRFFRLQGLNFSTGYTDFKPALPPEADAGADHFDGASPENGLTTFIILRGLPIARKVALLAQSPHRILRDSPNHVEILARENLRQGKKARLDFIVGIGMGFSDEQRALVRESFGATCLSPYSSKECSLIAWQCPHGNDHFHINAELALVEIIDDAGRPLAPGGEGRCIVTPFFNSAQPLIRYDQGDIVRRGQKPCPGGISLPVIESIVGRKDSIFRFPGHDVAIVGLDVVETRRLLQADAFQFAQTGPTDIVVRYIAQRDAPAEACDKVAKHFATLAGLPLAITFARVADIPANAGGKQQRFVREYEP